jgi:hypothetical protein
MDEPSGREGQGSAFEIGLPLAAWRATDRA